MSPDLKFLISKTGRIGSASQDCCGFKVDGSTTLLTWTSSTTLGGQLYVPNTMGLSTSFTISPIVNLG